MKIPKTTLLAARPSVTPTRWQLFSRREDMLFLERVTGLSSTTHMTPWGEKGAGWKQFGEARSDEITIGSAGRSRPYLLLGTEDPSGVCRTFTIQRSNLLLLPLALRASEEQGTERNYELVSVACDRTRFWLCFLDTETTDFTNGWHLLCYCFRNHTSTGFFSARNFRRLQTPLPVALSSSYQHSGMSSCERDRRDFI